MIQLSSTRSDSWSIIPNKLSLSRARAPAFFLFHSLSQSTRSPVRPQGKPFSERLTTTTPWSARGTMETQAALGVC